MALDWSFDDVLRENLDDSDAFGDENFWDRTFQSLIDEGNIELVDHAVRNHFPSDHVLEVGENYVLMGVYVKAADDNLRRLKIPFRPDQTLRNWLNQSFIPALNQAEHEYDQLTKEKHPLFFEDLSPFGTEIGKPWGWQATVTPVLRAQPNQGGNLDDADEFEANDDEWLVTITNKNHPDKQLSGVLAWTNDYPSDTPRVLRVERNDWNFPEDFAKKLLWATYWASEEIKAGKPSYEPFEIWPGDLMHLDRGGEELLKYHNDPEHYEKDKPASKPDGIGGWRSIGTHTWDESAETPFTKYVNGKIFTRMYEVDLANLFANTWFWPASNDPAFHRSPDEIIGDYPMMFIHSAAPIRIADYLETADSKTPLPSTGPDLDDVDEFEEVDDPELELQRWEDAETLAVRAARERMLEEFPTVDKGYKVLYVGARSTLDRETPDAHRIIKPYVIITRVPVTEVLDDKDEFISDDGMCYFCNAFPIIEWVTTEDPASGRRHTWPLCQHCRNSPDLQPYIVKDDVTESIDDTDEFRPRFARPINVVGHAYEHEADAALIYDFDDGARIYCLSAGSTTKFVLREPDGTVRVAPKFRSSLDAPDWFDPYYQGMWIAGVYEQGGKGMWVRGHGSVPEPIQPFTAQQGREWSQMVGSPVVKEGLDDTDEFGDIKLSATYVSDADETRIDAPLKMLLMYEDGTKVYWYYDDRPSPSESVLKLVDSNGKHKCRGISPDFVPGWMQPYMNGFWKANEFGSGSLQLTKDQEREFDAEMAESILDVEEPPPIPDEPIAEAIDDTDEFHDYKSDFPVRPCADCGADTTAYFCNACAPRHKEEFKLPDTDTFEPITTYCDACQEPTPREDLIRVPNYMSAEWHCKACVEKANQGPADDKWLERFYEDVEKKPVVDDTDEFEAFCDYCAYQAFDKTINQDQFHADHLEAERLCDVNGVISPAIYKDEMRKRGYVKNPDDVWWTTIKENLDDTDEFTNDRCYHWWDCDERGEPEFHAAHVAAFHEARGHFGGQYTALFLNGMIKRGYKPTNADSITRPISGVSDWVKVVKESIDDTDEFVKRPCQLWACSSRYDTNEFHAAHTAAEVAAQPAIHKDDKVDWVMYKKLFNAAMDQHGYKEIYDGDPQHPLRDWVKKDLPSGFRVAESIDDTDEFVDSSRCERCNSTSWVEPVYFNNTMEHLCRWCAKALYTESVDDTDVFGDIQVTAVYEEIGAGKMKMLFVFEDGAKIYYSAYTFKEYDGRPSLPNTIFVLKSPTGETHVTRDEAPDSPPDEHLERYYESMYAINEPKPFPQALLKEFDSVIAAAENTPIKEDLDDKDEFDTQCRTCERDTYRAWEWPPEILQKFHLAHQDAAYWTRSNVIGTGYHIYDDKMREFGFERYPSRSEFVPIVSLRGDLWLKEDLDDTDKFQEYCWYCGYYERNCPVIDMDQFHEDHQAAERVADAAWPKYKYSVWPGATDEYKTQKNNYHKAMYAEMERLGWKNDGDCWVASIVKEDLDDTDEFQDNSAPQLTAWVKWPEGKFESPEAAVAAAFFVMEQQGFDLTLDDTYIFKPTDKNNPNRWKYEKIRLIAFVPDSLVQALREEGDLTFGSTHREPWVIFDIDVQDNEWVLPPRRDDDDEDHGRRSGYRMPGYSWDESRTPADVAQVIEEDSPPTISAEQLAKILNDRKIKPSPEYIAPAPDESPELEIKHQPTELGTLGDEDEFEDNTGSPCDDNVPHGGWDVQLIDVNNNIVTDEFQKQYPIDFWTGEHPSGFDAGGCVVWIAIQDDWDGNRPFPSIYYWRGRWRPEDEPIRYPDEPVTEGNRAAPSKIARAKDFLTRAVEASGWHLENIDVETYKSRTGSMTVYVGVSAPTAPKAADASVLDDSDVFGDPDVTFHMSIWPDGKVWTGGYFKSPKYQRNDEAHPPGRSPVTSFERDIYITDPTAVQDVAKCFNSVGKNIGVL